MAYSDKQRAQAIKLVEANGGSIDEQTLNDIRALLKNSALSWQTVRNWTAPKNLDDKKKDEADRYDSEPLPVLLESVARSHIRHANDPDAIKQVNAQQSMTSAAIAIDKMRLLQGLPTEIVQVMPALIDEIDKAGLSASDVFGAMLQKFKSVNEANRVK